MSDAKTAKPKKLLTRVITLYFDCNGDGTGDEKGVNRNIDIEFDVEEFVVRSVSSSSGAFVIGALPTICSHNLSSEFIIAAVPAAVDTVAMATPQTRFITKSKSIRGAQTFQILDAGIGSFSVFAGFIMVTLEFRGHV